MIFLPDLPKRSVLLALVAAGFVSVSLAQDQAKITKPVVSEKACPAQVLSVPTRDGHKATAVVRKPPGKGPFPAVIYLHGTLGSSTADQLKESLKGPPLSRFLASGYVTVAATFRDRRQDPLTPEALTDCIAITEHLKKMPEVDAKSIVVWGQSGGGSLALELAGDMQLCAIAATEPATGLFTGMYNKNNLKGKPPYSAADGRHIMEDPKSFYTPDLQKHTREKIAKISCPIFIAHGDVDIFRLNRFNNEFFIPELKQAKKHVEVILYRGERHGSLPGSKKFFDDCHAFFKRHVTRQPTPLEESLVKQVPVD